MKALSIRQPWAWLIIHGGKDVENRSWPTWFRGQVLIHASKGMSKEEWEDGYEYARYGVGGIIIPGPDQLQRGGIIGQAEIIDCVTSSDSPWFEGPHGFILRNAKPVPFRPFKGELGLFETHLELTELETAI